MSIWIIKFTHPFKKAAIPVCLKPCQNNKDQLFVVMLNFCMYCFEFASAACCKKRHAKNGASLQKFGCFYFVRALVRTLPRKYLSNENSELSHESIFDSHLQTCQLLTPIFSRK